MKKSVSGNSKRDKFFFALGILLVGVAIFQLFHIGMESKKRNEVYKEFENDAVEKEIADKQSESDTEKQAKEEFDYRKVKIDFDNLKKTNEDIIGWILFDKNGISYPVLQGKDNEEYLYLRADKQKDSAGSIFMDASCSADLTDSHTIIYGHNMKDLSMFGKLKQYRLQKDYYKENRFFTIYTPEKICRYVIFAWYEAAEDDAVYQVGFSENKEFEAFVEQMINRRSQDTKIGADKEDKIVTLSTCSTTGKRFVVHGKLTKQIKR